ncbi:MAG: hypothetical protein LBP61_01160 [Desulfovibrio sp.]|jgi:PAS domain-containing protein|nr:hypothetical protein [Desulfovibrio sp.]
MSLADSEHRQQELLKALSQARAYVRWLEGIAARNAAFLGLGVDFEDQFVSSPPPETAALRAALQALGLEMGGEDLSNYLGREGDDESRPRLTDAPDDLKPAGGRRISRGIGLVAVEPAAALLPLPGVAAEEQPLAGAPPFPETESGLQAGEDARPGIAVSGIDLSLLEEDPAERDPLLPGPEPSPLQPAGDDPYAPSAGIDPLTPEPATDAFLQAVLALAGEEDGVWDRNMRTGVVFASRRWQDLLSCPEDSGASLQEALVRFLDPADVPAFFSACDSLLAGKLPAASLKLRFQLPLGGRFQGHLRAVCPRQGGQAVRLTAALTALPENFSPDQKRKK